MGGGAFQRLPVTLFLSSLNFSAGTFPVLGVPSGKGSDFVPVADEQPTWYSAEANTTLQ